MNQITIASIIVAGGLVVAAFLATNGGTQNGSGVKTFDIVMQNNQYQPSEITANVGDRVVINFENKDQVAHGVALTQFNATVPGGHIQPGRTARMEFVADRVISTDAALCGGPNPTDKTDTHGEELIVNII
jgi:plastocyanin